MKYGGVEETICNPTLGLCVSTERVVQLIRCGTKSDCLLNASSESVTALLTAFSDVSANVLNRGRESVTQSSRSRC
jgi:hypothetical protein